MAFTDNLDDDKKFILELMVADITNRVPTLTREEVIEDFNKFNNFVEELIENGMSEDDALKKAQKEYHFTYEDKMKEYHFSYVEAGEV